MAGVFFCISPNHCSDSTGPCSERHAGKLGPDSQRLSRSTSQAQIAGANIFSNKLALMRLCRGIFTEGKLGACLSDGIPWDVEEFDLSHDGKLVAFESNEDGISKLHLASLPNGAEKTLPALPAGVLDGIRFRTEGHELGFELTTSSSPDDVYSIDADTGKLDRWTASETGGVSLQTEQAPRLIHWDAADAVRISGFLYPANARFTGPRPVMISIHGGPEGQSRPTFGGSLNYYTEEMGLTVIEPKGNADVDRSRGTHA